MLQNCFFRCSRSYVRKAPSGNATLHEASVEDKNLTIAVAEQHPSMTSCPFKADSKCHYCKNYRTYCVGVQEEEGDSGTSNMASSSASHQARGC